MSFKKLEILLNQPLTLIRDEIDVARWPAFRRPKDLDNSDWKDFGYEEEAEEFIYGMKSVATAYQNNDFSIHAGQLQFHFAIENSNASISWTVKTGARFEIQFASDPKLCELVSQSPLQCAQEMARRFLSSDGQSSQQEWAEAPLVNAITLREAFIAGKQKQPNPITIVTDPWTGEYFILGMTDAQERIPTNIQAAKAFDIIENYAESDDNKFVLTIRAREYKIAHVYMWEFLTPSAIRKIAAECNAILDLHALPIIPVKTIQELADNADYHSAFSVLNDESIGFTISDHKLIEGGMENLTCDEDLQKSDVILKDISNVIYVDDEFVTTKNNIYSLHPYDGMFTNLGLYPKDHVPCEQRGEEDVEELPILAFSFEPENEGSDFNRDIHKLLSDLRSKCINSLNKVEMSETKDFFGAIFHALIDLSLSRFALATDQYEFSFSSRFQGEENEGLSIIISRNLLADRALIPFQKVFIIDDEEVRPIFMMLNFDCNSRPSKIVGEELRASAEMILAQYGVTNIELLISQIDQRHIY